MNISIFTQQERYCFVLWLAVTLVAMIGAGIKRYKSKSFYKDKKYYIEQLLVSYNETLNLWDAILDVSFCMKRHSAVYKIICDGKKDILNPSIDENKIIYKITQEMDCYVIEILHETLIASSGRQLTKSVVELLQLIKNIWQQENGALYRKRGAQWIITFIYKEMMFLINIMIYLRWHQIISLNIAIVINTVGLIIFILLDYRWVIEEENINEGNLAFLKWLIKISVLSSDNSVNNAIGISRDLTVQDYKNVVKKLSDDITKNPNTIWPYHNMIGQIGMIEAYDCMNCLYENASNSGEKIQQQITEKIKSFVIEMKRLKERNKTQEPAFSLRGMYQMIAGVGLMCNIATILFQLVERAI